MRVSALATTAVKGFGLHHREALTLDADGAVGDRSFYLVDAEGRMAAANYDGRLFGWWTSFDPSTEVLTIADGSQIVYEAPVVGCEQLQTRFFGDRHQGGTVVGGRWSELISELAGEPVRLVRATGGLHGRDVEPVSLMSEASAHALGTEADGGSLDPGRFRMNVVVDGLAPFAEESWIGTSIDVGSVRLRVVSPVGRCSMVQRRSGDGGQRLRVLRMIAQVRGAQPSQAGRSLNLGVYARVERPGTVTLDDPVLLHETTGA